MHSIPDNIPLPQKPVLFSANNEPRFPPGRSRRYRRASAGFTLIELLVVIAIISVLLALMVPAVHRYREVARRMECGHHLGRIALAMTNYEAAFEAFPPAVYNPTGPIQHVAEGQHAGWLVMLLPFLDEKNTFEQFDLVAGAYAEGNAPIRNLRRPGFLCPTDAGVISASWGRTSFAASHHAVEEPIHSANNGALVLNRPLRREEFTDGLQYTLFVGEKFSYSGDLGWCSGTRATIRNTGTPLNQALLAPEPGILPQNLPEPADPLHVGGFGSFHHGGAQFVFGDGSVRFLNNSISQEIYHNMAHRSDAQLEKTSF